MISTVTSAPTPVANATGAPPAAPPASNIADTVEFKSAVEAAVASTLAKAQSQAPPAKPKDPSRAFKLMGAVAGGAIGAAAGLLMIPGLPAAGYLAGVGGYALGNRISNATEGSDFGTKSPLGKMVSHRDFGRSTGPFVFPRWTSGVAAVGAVAAFGFLWAGLSPDIFWTASSQILGAVVTGAAGAKIGAQLCTVKKD